MAGLSSDRSLLLRSLPNACAASKMHRHGRRRCFLAIGESDLDVQVDGSALLRLLLYPLAGLRMGNGATDEQRGAIPFV
eukprot:4706147-Pleurochrysis_carterae.AAC.1